MTVVSLIDSTTALNRAFLQLPQALDVWHPDRLYGLDPAYKLLLGQFTVALAISFLPLVILRREANQPYAWMYKTLILAGVMATIVLASVTLWNFNHALERVRLAGITATVDELHSIPLRPTTQFDATHQICVLLEYQNIVALPKSLPIPGWLAFLATSRTLLIAVELYSLLQPVLKTPAVPKLVRKWLEQ